MIIKYPLLTEKAVRFMESENKLIIIVDMKANKNEIKNHFENIFKVKVRSVNTHIVKGQKRAYIKLDPETPAINIMTELGLM